LKKRFSQSLFLFFVMLLCASCAAKVEHFNTFGVEKFTGSEKPPIHYVETGKGQPIILVPGLFGTNNVWRRMIPHLEDNYRLLAIDNFGTGKSGRPEGDFNYTVAEQADMIVAMMDDLNIQSCDIVGVSYGGMIALNIAARYPERVVSIVSIEGAVIMPKNTPYNSLIQGLKYPVLGDAIIGFIRSGMFDKAMAKSIMGESWDTLQTVEQAEITAIISKNADAASRRTWLSLARALNKAEDFAEEAKLITAPVLYLSGDKSEFREMTDMNVSYFKNHLPNVELVSFADGVHDLELQKPRVVSEMVAEFIERMRFGNNVVAESGRL
jgi:pimeloyl-ACP methyl ester carboxylesterase